MAAPNSRSTLIDYCLRSLGAPVVEINVDEDQVEDRIDEALQLYQHYHADAIEKVFIKYQMHLNDLYSLGYMGSLVEYEMAQQWLSLVDILTDPDGKHISFDRHKNQLRVDMDWSKEVVVGSFIVVECYRILDPDTFTDVYNDYFLKRYATALIKHQWGTNLSKFEGMVMPGGVTFNGRQILEDAKEELKELNEEIRLNWEQPVDFYTG